MGGSEVRWTRDSLDTPNAPRKEVERNFGLIQESVDESRDSTDEASGAGGVLAAASGLKAGVELRLGPEARDGSFRRLLELLSDIAIAAASSDSEVGDAA